SDGVVNLATGGVLTAPLIYSGDGVTEAMAGNASLNFHGGTLVTNADQADYLRLMDAYVYSEGAKIDTAGHDVTINRALLAPGGYGVQSIELDGFNGFGYQGAPAVRITGGSGTGATAVATVANGEITGITATNPGSGYLPGDEVTATLWGGGAELAADPPVVTLDAYATSGGLQKLGLGTLTLAGANTYTGPTSVEAGCLDIDGSITSDVTVAATASVSGSGTITGNVDLNGVFDVAYDSDNDTVELLTIIGELDLTGSTLRLADRGMGTLAAGEYVLAAYGSLVGIPATTLGLLSGWSLDYAYDYDGGTDNSIALIVPGVASIPGDTNGDRRVDATDARKLAENWGNSVGAEGFAKGDFNGDGLVNALDASILAANWGDYTGGESTTPVPEPSSIILLTTCLAMLFVRRRR
ncbi:MAG: PEP-CTERM sorting domain-containing protein, partial [Pirellulaceae bacterium]|nr:PEP-CTERM sorting domain-containing protein [Pirellulaceae bacterium]